MTENGQPSGEDPNNIPPEVIEEINDLLRKTGTTYNGQGVWHTVPHVSEFEPENVNRGRPSRFMLDDLSRNAPPNRADPDDNRDNPNIED